MNGQDTQKQNHSLQFTGTGGEYFKIWIVNILLSIVTLGIYSAWAKVRTKRYFYGNTLLQETPFEYHATPKQILIGRLIAVMFFIIYVVASETYPAISGVLLLMLVAATPWIIFRSIRFNARVSSYRNVRFNFKGAAPAFYKYIYLYAVLPAMLIGLIAAGLYYLDASLELVSGLSIAAILSFYAVFPWVQRNVTEYVNNNYTYGQGRFSTDPALSTGEYYALYFGALIIFMLIVILLAVILFYSFGNTDFSQLYQTNSSGEIDPQAMAPLIPLLITIYGAIFVAGFVARAFVQSGIRKHVFARTKLDNVLRLSSTVATGKLFMLFLTNFLLLVFTLGFAYPWIKVRIARYFAINSHVVIRGDLSHYVSQQQDKQSALGDELGELFDVDMDLGI